MIKPSSAFAACARDWGGVATTLKTKAKKISRIVKSGLTIFDTTDLDTTDKSNVPANGGIAGYGEIT
jgi:hypothetical protein